MRKVQKIFECYNFQKITKEHGSLIFLMFKVVQEKLIKRYFLQSEIRTIFCSQSIDYEH